LWFLIQGAEVVNQDETLSLFLLKTLNIMKKILVSLVFLLPLAAMSQINGKPVEEPVTVTKMKIGMIIYSNDPETVWNAFRFGNFALGEGDTVRVFLLGKGVECQKLDSSKFEVNDQIRRFTENGGKIFACGTCLASRNMEGSEICPLSTMQDMYEIVKWCNKVITF
jgi:sulfur relay (sulfurtransferase) complex TusBCD TusD component (DsrE family)